MIYNIALSDEQLAILNTLLIEAPYKISAPLITHINNEIIKIREAFENQNVQTE